jgi:hypothetical protein
MKVERFKFGWSLEQFILRYQTQESRSRAFIALQTKNEKEVILAEAVTVDPFEASEFWKKSNIQKKRFALYN